MCDVQACIWLIGHLVASAGDLSWVLMCVGVTLRALRAAGQPSVGGYMRLLLCYREIMLMVVGVGTARFCFGGWAVLHMLVRTPVYPRVLNHKVFAGYAPVAAQLAVLASAGARRQTLCCFAVFITCVSDHWAGLGSSCLAASGPEELHNRSPDRLDVSGGRALGTDVTMGHLFLVHLLCCCLSYSTV